MAIKEFSPKQLQTLCWWCDSSPYRDWDAIICDGAVRSGKTLSLSLSFALWSLSRFDGQSFALCGKTVTALRRNLVTPLMEALHNTGIECSLQAGRNVLTLKMGKRSNRYYLFGGRDEGSAALIQGVTLAGVLLDEVALMPRSFVEQALARCSVASSKFWFGCNPDHPQHWFYREWIAKAGQKRALYLHFTMQDNPALSDEIRSRYETLYSGAFYQRYVQGKWVAAQGAVYPMFCEKRHVVQSVPRCSRFVVSCDYGTVNPASFGLWGYDGAVWYRVREYYHDARKTGVQKTDEEYADELIRLAGNAALDAVVVDPSAASFITCLRKRGVSPVLPARNDVMDGIRRVAAALGEERIKFHQSCGDTLREFALYRWDLEANGDRPRKEQDHAMDDIRYFVGYAMQEEECGFAAATTTRRGAF